MRKLLALRKGTMTFSSLNAGCQEKKHELEQRTHSQILGIAGVTMTNGGDNLGVYIPLFASNVGTILAYAAIFSVMTAAWCAMGFMLVNNPLVGSHIRRYGHVVLPFVLMLLGLYIVADAIVWFR